MKLDFQTTGQIARRSKATLQMVDYYVRALDIAPATRCGILRLYSPEQAALITRTMQSRRRAV